MDVAKWKKEGGFGRGQTAAAERVDVGGDVGGEREDGTKGFEHEDAFEFEEVRRRKGGN